MKRFLIQILIIMILQTIAEFISVLLELQWDHWVFMIGAICGVIYGGLDELIFNKMIR